jgi:hypothetical protein
MLETKAYEEIVEFIAAGTDPRSVIDFQPSAEVRERVAVLLERERGGLASAEEKAELDHFAMLEHLMRLAKARAREHLAARG